MLPRPLHWLMADMAAADTAGAADMVATAFMVVTPVDFTDAVPTSLAVAIAAVTKGTGEHMAVMVATADMVAIVDTAERTDRAKMTTTDAPAKGGIEGVSKDIRQFNLSD